MRIYIAGPCAPRDCSLHDAARVMQHNVNRAIEIANQLIRLGHQPFVPHLSFYIHTHYSCYADYGNWWYEYDLTFLDIWAEALFYIAPSRGADVELKRAEELGLKIFRDIKEVPKNV